MIVSGNIRDTYFLQLQELAMTLARKTDFEDPSSIAICAYNSAFCVEIGFKSILYHLDKEAKQTHDLFVLWKQLGLDCNAFLASSMSGSLAATEDLLEIIKGTFKDWRYFYQNLNRGRIETNIDLLLDLSKAISFWLDENVINWRLANFAY